jgi:hypothetical protein
MTIAALGKHQGGESNANIVRYLSEDRGRTFMNVSQLEFKQLVRLYRKTFGDLLKKERLIR